MFELRVCTKAEGINVLWCDGNEVRNPSAKNLCIIDLLEIAVRTIAYFVMEMLEDLLEFLIGWRKVSLIDVCWIV